MLKYSLLFLTIAMQITFVLNSHNKSINVRSTVSLSFE